MIDLVKNSLTWRVCAAIFAFFGRLWHGSYTYSLLAKFLKAKPLAQDSACAGALDWVNAGVNKIGSRLRADYPQSLLGRICAKLMQCKLMQTIRQSYLVSLLLSGGITSILLIVIAAYTPIDYFLRDVAKLDGIASVWDELLMIFCLMWIVVQRTMSKQPLKSRLNTMDFYLGFYVLIGIVLLFHCYTKDYFDVNITGFRASMQYILLFYIVSRLIRDDRDFMLMYKLLMASAFLFALHGIYQFVIGVEIPAHWTDQAEGAVRTRVFSIFSNPNIMGAYMIMIAPMAIGMAYSAEDLASKLFYWFAGGCMCLACLFTMSRGAWLGLAVAAILFALIVDRRLFVLFLVGGICACFLPFVRSRILYLFTDEFRESNARGGRGKRWSTAFSYLDMYDRWEFGLGYGMFGGAVAVQNKINPKFEYMYVDNYYVKIIVENGIAGITAFLTSVFGLLWNGLRACGLNSENRYKPLCAGMLTGLIACLVQSFFESLWEEPYMMAIFFAVAGMLVYAGFFRKNTQTQK